MKKDLTWKVETKNLKMSLMILEIHLNILKRRKNLLENHSKNLKNQLKITKRSPISKKRKISNQRVTKALKIKKDELFL